MPTYEFRCPEGHEFEKFYRTISGAASTAECPTCGLVAERMMSATGFAFKGSGFYLTDYGKNAHRGEPAPNANPGESAAKETAAESSNSAAAPSGDEKSASGKTDGAKSAESSPSGGESKKSESKAADVKPAPATTKPSASE